VPAASNMYVGAGSGDTPFRNARWIEVFVFLGVGSGTMPT
jgi:hypothetical protein